MPVLLCCKCVQPQRLYINREIEHRLKICRWPVAKRMALMHVIFHNDSLCVVHLDLTFFCLVRYRQDQPDRLFI